MLANAESEANSLLNDRTDINEKRYARVGGCQGK